MSEKWRIDMTEWQQLANFHFLRPLWLLMLIPSVVLFVMLLRQQGTLKQWQRVIAPHLLDHLIVGTEQKARFRPVHALFSLCIFASVALAGPTWEREPSPFTEDTASLVIALDLSMSMNAIDIQPTRLQRAQQKVRDLLALRKGARTALIAYAGSAHMVLPLTDDPNILETYLNSLRTDIMPVQGKDPSRALALAKEIMKDQEAPGTILFISDGISRDHLPSFIEHGQKSNFKVLVLGIGTAKGGPVLIRKNEYMKDASGMTVVSRLDSEGLESLSDKAGAFVTTVTVDDSDVRRINSRIESHLKAMQSEDENMRWKDFGYFMIIPVVFLSLFWFRRGWTVQWG
jgi:Ca-activated chloride channel family protein